MSDWNGGYQQPNTEDSTTENTVTDEVEKALEEELGAEEEAGETASAESSPKKKTSKKKTKTAPRNSQNIFSRLDVEYILHFEKMYSEGSDSLRKNIAAIIGLDHEDMTFAEVYYELYRLIGTTVVVRELDTYIQAQNSSPREARRALITFNSFVDNLDPDVARALVRLINTVSPAGEDSPIEYRSNMNKEDLRLSIEDHIDSIMDDGDEGLSISELSEALDVWPLAKPGVI